MKHECKFVVFSLKMAIFTASAAGLNLHLFKKKNTWCIIGPISIDQTPSRFKKHTLKFNRSTLMNRIPTTEGFSYDKTTRKT
jgi:hypothetical protein